MIAMLEQWNAISRRIKGLVEVAKFECTNSKDFISQCHDILDCTKVFKEQFKPVLESTTLLKIDAFITRWRSPINGLPSRRRNFTFSSNANDFLTSLSLLENEITYALSDVQIIIRSLTERAFAHLQRSIEVDPDTRRKWFEAFEKGETECEKLGAVHLLLHGIWAFKVDAIGASTDLVYKEPVEDLTSIQSYADGLVLTEWKKAGTRQEAEKQYEQARSQMSRYKQGALGGMELTGYRYAVIVTKTHLKKSLDDINEGSVIYRPINIAVDPEVPSKG